MGVESLRSCKNTQVWVICNLP